MSAKQTFRLSHDAIHAIELALIGKIGRENTFAREHFNAVTARDIRDIDACNEALRQLRSPSADRLGDFFYGSAA